MGWHGRLKHRAREPNGHIAVVLTMTPTLINSDKKTAIFIWIGTIVFVFTTGAIMFGQ